MTGSNTSGWALRSLLVALPSSVLACLVTLWVVSPSSGAPVPPQSELASEQILQQLDELGREMGAGFRDAAGPVSTIPAAERRPISEGESLAEEMKEIIGRLERLWSVVPSGGAGNQVLVQQRYAPTNVNALEALGRLNERDPEAAKRTTLLLSPTEVVARFGFPDSVGNSDNGTLFFAYNRPGPDGEDFALFNFRDGFVVYYGIDSPNR